MGDGPESEAELGAARPRPGHSVFCSSQMTLPASEERFPCDCGGAERELYRIARWVGAEPNEGAFDAVARCKTAREVAEHRLTAAGGADA